MRKFWLGLAYIVGGNTLIGIALLRAPLSTTTGGWAEGTAGVLAATAAAIVSLAPGLASIVWGNVQVHRAQGNGNGNGNGGGGSHVESSVSAS